jgi:hypothetical protein
LSADAGDLRSIHRNLKTTSLKIINWIFMPQFSMAQYSIYV